MHHFSSFTSAAGVGHCVLCQSAGFHQGAAGFDLVLYHQLGGNPVRRSVKAPNIAVFGWRVQTQGLKWREREEKDPVYV